MSLLSQDPVLEKGFWDVGDCPTSRPWSRRAKDWVVDHVRPSFTRQATRSSGHGARRLANLDGLRGFVALLVYLGHHQLWAHEALPADRILENAYGYDNQRYFACLPVVRLFFSGGHFAVAVFFVLSGYVLSAKPLAMIHAGEQLRLSDNLSSAMFRRWLRLHLPVMATTFLNMTSWHLFRYRPADPEPRPTYGDDVWNWYAEFKNVSFVFRTGGEPWFTYNFHVWTIPVEFRGSLVVYTALLALSRCTRNARLWWEVGLITYFLYIADGWFGAAFIAGMLLCDLDLLAQDNLLPRPLEALAPFKTPLCYLLLAISLYLGGCPAFSSDVAVLRQSPGWYYLSFLKPQAVFDYKWFYLFWAATCLVACLSRIAWLRAFFEMRFNQYLGRISFAFYLVHGPILRVLGDRVYAAVGWTKESHAVQIPGWINLLPLPKFGPLGLEPSFLVCHLILLPVTLWVAELTTTFIDEPTVQFAQWLYRKSMAPAVKL